MLWQRNKKAIQNIMIKSLLPSFLFLVHTNTALSYVPPVVHVASLSIKGSEEHNFVHSLYE